MIRRCLLALLPLLLAACDETSSPPVNTPLPPSTPAPQATGAASETGTPAPGTAGFTVQSPDLQNGGTVAPAQVFNGFGCTGRNISPALSWSGAPATTKSYALTIYDPDAPTGSGFWHWVVYDIPAQTTSLPPGAGALASTLLPAGAKQARSDFGTAAYGGPCPPQGDRPHHYILTVSALDVAPLPVPDNPTPAVVGFTVHFHVVGTARLTALYGR
jgi:Raf kinase inhibitor-like YbhB/YbcL family protein